MLASTCLYSLYAYCILRLSSNFGSLISTTTPTPPAFGASFVVTPIAFCRDLWRQKTRVFGPPFGVVCVILRLAVTVKHRLVTDRQTDGQTDT